MLKSYKIFKKSFSGLNFVIIRAFDVFFHILKAHTLALQMNYRTQKMTRKKRAKKQQL
jgi:hypothetical protein